MGGSSSKPATSEPLVPWRDVYGGDMHSALSHLTREIRKHQKMDLKITLVGHSGAGKSSLMNSIFSISRGRMADTSHVKGENVAGVGTLRFGGVRAGEQDMFQSVTILDTMGFTRAARNEGQGITEVDLKRVCNGEIKIGSQFNVDSAEKAKSQRYRPNCVIFVASAELFIDLDSIAMKTMKEKMEGLNSCVSNDIAKMAVLTKCDLVCDDTAKDFSNVFKSKVVERLVKRAATTFGLQESKVFPIVNYTKEVELTTPKSVPIMYVIRYALDFAKDRAEGVLPDED